MTTHTHLVIETATGRIVERGDTVTNFRGEAQTFDAVSRIGRTGTPKLVGSWMGERNANVFGLVVIDYTPRTDAPRDDVTGSGGGVW